MAGEYEAAIDTVAGNIRARGGGGYGQCLNCGTALIGSHCHACGQSGDVHRSLAAIGHDIGHGVFHFEGRIWRTLPMLVLHPGALTRRYIAGERARFISPLAIFLFTVFLMFAIYGAIAPKHLADGLANGLSGSTIGLARAKVETTNSIAAIERHRAAIAAKGGDVTADDRRLVEARADLAEVRSVESRLKGMRGDVTITSAWPWLDASIAAARANPGLVLYKIQSSAYKYSWALILLSLPFVALLFLWRRRFGLYDHMIFTTYSIAFMSLLVIVLEIGLMASVPSWILWPVAVVVPPVHMFGQLRGAYGLSAFSALWRTTLLVSFALSVLLFFVLGLVAMGIAG